MDKLTLRQKIGQMLMIGFPTPQVTPEFEQLLEEYKIGNIIFFTHNVVNSRQLHQLCADLQDIIRRATGHVAFLSVDQEGGMVARMPADAVSIPAAMAIAATRKPENAYLAGKITGTELAALGLNMNLAPDLDINSNPQNPVIGVRSFGDTKETVTEFGIPLLRGLRDGGVLPVIKHFPGHGDTAVDSHLGLPRIEKTLEQLQREELVPFQSAIQNGACAVMSSHILFPNIEKENVPCTMSHTMLTEVLRNKLNFQGLIVTDCLEMDAIQKYYGTAQGAIEAIRAGANLLCISHSAALVKETVEAVEYAVKTGALSEELIDASAEKILQYKDKYENPNHIPPFSCVGSDAHRKEIARISEESVTLVNQGKTGVVVKGKKVLFLGSYANRSTLASSSVNKAFSFPAYMAEQLNGDGVLTPMNPSEEEINRIAEKASGYDVLVLGTYHGQRYRGQAALANKLSGDYGNLVVASLFSPYELAFIDDSATKLCAYEYTPLSFQTLVKVLSGEVVPSGKLRVKI